MHMCVYNYRNILTCMVIQIAIPHAVKTIFFRAVVGVKMANHRSLHVLCYMLNYWGPYSRLMFLVK